MARQFTESMTLAEVAKTSPRARKIVEKYFGKDCFSCPSFSGEPLFMGARMHAVELETVLKELNKVH
ncbi:MAG: DUF1858 domain-containing protein [Candidatus Glassbacteria bacterium]|nr:DUF1858 domain-containing protein [Candidatus Glassbacteria bacterium]